MDQPAASPSLAARVFQSVPVRLLLGFLWMVFVLIAAELPTVAVPNLAEPLRVLLALAGAGAGLLGYAAFVQVVERRPVTELAPGPAPAELLQGIGLGALLFTLTIAGLWLLGIYRVTGTNAVVVLWPALTVSITSGVLEELLFRGIIFRIAQEGLGTWLALLLSALMFGALHLANPNATLVAGLAVAIEAGLLLAAAYLVTRRLWVPIGLHFAWNFTQGGIFGVAVSGITGQGLLRSTLQGPELLSGGGFGAEASLVAIVVCLAAALLLLRRAWRQGRFVAPVWARKPGTPLA